MRRAPDHACQLTGERRGRQGAGLYSAPMDPRTEINSLLEDGAPELFRALSPLGRRVYFPPDVPAQSAEARGKEINGTIGQITDGRGGAVPLPTLAGALAGLSSEDLSRALLYSPVEGIPEVRQRWRAWQRRGVAEGIPSSLPLVTAGLTHSLSVLADLFGGEGRPVAIPRPFWGNYRQAFATRTGAEVRTAPACVDGRCNTWAISSYSNPSSSRRMMTSRNSRGRLSMA